MTSTADGAQAVLEPEVEDRTRTRPDHPWVTIVFNDPVNLMSYVTYVFQSYFGYSRLKSEKLMYEVHEDGRSVVATGTREEMERDTQAMHGFGLWAACRPSDRGNG
ncbi:ATP-dependent Clp protease adapter ClpS [Brevibacterium ihuae]|uniref:ATP-dependent Clp protease adapter ClpS n=1 Tax=Brevibacterium ihuae TaxID=1631743 RepID=UPI000C75C13C|nr:ATP-dependent Clp protease adapter ClpS [Brevibacterium ihuae]